MAENESLELLRPLGMGWLPDIPDFRDYTPEHKDVKPLLARLKLKKIGNPAIPVKADLRADCSPIENQGSLGACTAFAAIGLLEYFERRAGGKHIDGSHRFLYKVSRKLLNWTGDTGCHPKTTMGAMVLFGVPPQKFWPYEISHFDDEPTSFVYSIAQNYKTVKYYRRDPAGTAYNAAFLTAVKIGILAHLPSMFGFACYPSLEQASTTGCIPFPVATEKCEGGHAVSAMGYDDNKKIKNSKLGGIETKGAFLIRNSWGTGWGPLGGYLWLPYEFVLRGLTCDWWSLISAEWVETGQFGF